MTPGGAITVAGAIVIFVAISIGLLSLQYCFYAWDTESHGARPRRRRRRGDGTAGSNGGGVRTRGVDPEVMRALPVTVYRAAAPGSKEDAAECSVCLAELQDGEEARFFLPHCGHGFHAECVDMWLASHTTCPLCRLTVSKPDPESSQTPTPASALRSLPPEPANPPRSVLLGVSDQGAVTAANMITDDGDDTTASASTAAVVIEIPELAVLTPTPRDAAKSPFLARPRSFRRLWSFERQGTSSSSSCTCGAAGEVVDVEQGISVTVGMAVAEAQLPSEATPGAAQGSAV
jgi:E3 ubiquitin-protein ligase EL5